MLATRSRLLPHGLTIPSLLGGGLPLASCLAQLEQSSAWLPRADIVERTSDFVVSIDLPGLAPEDIDIQLKEDVLTISGRRSFQKLEQDDRSVSMERSQGSFHRSFRLSETIDGENIKASASNGVLTLTLPKRPASQPRKIQIQA